MVVRILVADDSATIQKVIKIAFSRYDVSVVEASSYLEALREAQSSQPHLTIVDASLVGTQGPEDFEKLQLAAGGSPMLLLAGSYESIDESKFQLLGLSQFLKKPFDTSHIIKKIREDLRIDLSGKFDGTVAGSSSSSNTLDRETPPSALPGMNSASDEKLDQNSELPSEAAMPGSTPDLGFSGRDKSVGFGQELENSGDKTVITEMPELPPAFNGDSIRDISDEYSSELDTLSASESDAFPADPFAKMREAEGEGSEPAPMVDSQARGTPAFDRSESLPDPVLSPQPDPVLSPQPDPTPTESPKFDSGSYRDITPEPELSDSHTPAIEPLSREELRDMVTPIMREELRATIREAVTQYCQENFNDLAREIILEELRRLADEKSQHLANS